MKQADFQKSLESLDLQGTVLVIGLLSQHALELMAQKAEKTAIHVPAKQLIL